MAELPSSLPAHLEFLARRIARTRDPLLERLISHLLVENPDEAQFLSALRALASERTTPRDPARAFALRASGLWQEWEYWREDRRRERQWQ